MKSPGTTISYRLLGIFLLGLLCPLATAVAQDPAPTPTPAPEEQQAPTAVDAQRLDAAPPLPQEQQPVEEDSSYDRPSVNLATGQVLKNTLSPLHWGHLSLLSFDLLQVYDSNYLFLKDNPVSAQAGAVEGLVAYTLKTGRTNLSLQYRPQVWMSSDAAQFDYTSHAADLHLSRRFSPKWAVNFTDQYQWVADRGHLDTIGFTPDYSASKVNQGAFLSAGRHLMSNTADITVDHNFTAHSSVEILARHQYIQLSSLPAGSAAATIDPAAAYSMQQIYGGQLGWNYQWTRNNSLRVHYAYDQEYFHDSHSTAQFHSAQFGFSRQLRPSLVFQVSGGPSLVLPATQPGATQAANRQISYQGSAVLFKTFHRAGITLSYSRNDNFTGQISDGLNDRVDASLSERLFRRIDLLLGGAYIRQNYSSGAHLQGKSGWTEVHYRLSPSWSLYATYSYLTQDGGPTLFGPRQLITSGIRWSWDPGRGGGF